MTASPQDSAPSTFTATRIGRRGRFADRVLLIADVSSLVTGTEPPVQLAEHLADELVARTGRGLDLDVLVDLAPALRAVGGATRAWRVWRYDAVVVLVHDVAATTQPVRALVLRRLLRRVLHEMAATSLVQLVFLDPGTRDARGRASRRYALAVARTLDDHPDRTATLSIPAGLLDVIGDAAVIAAALAARLVANSPAAAADPHSAARQRQEPADETDRQHAVDTARHALQGESPGLERVVLMARNSFQVPHAEITLLDRGALHTVARVGDPTISCHDLLRRIGAGAQQMMLLEDTRTPTSTSGTRPAEPVVFYAGYPIESNDGYWIGVLSVFDVEPHLLEEDDDILLRDLALLAGAELSALDR